MNRCIAFACPLMLLASPVWAATEQVEISGPILPNVMVLYQSEGANFPATLAEEESLASQAALTYPFLLDACAPLYPDITLLAPGDPPLTQAQLNTNYDQVAECSYVEYTSKPYWIPKLVDDVDICGSALGAGWRLISESDLASFTETEFQFFADTLSAVSAGTSGFGTFYFSLNVYVRGSDGTLMVGDLNPGVSQRTMALPVSGETTKSHYESGLALRCIRRTDITSTEVSS